MKLQYISSRSGKIIKAHNFIRTMDLTFPHTRTHQFVYNNADESLFAIGVII